MAVAGIDDQLTHPLWCEANAACFKAVLHAVSQIYICRYIELLL